MDTSTGSTHDDSQKQRAEFDTVILGAPRSPRANDYELLAHFEWCLSERDGASFKTSSNGRRQRPYSKTDSHLRQNQERNEAQRLLYVAATRAQNELHLIAQGSINPTVTFNGVRILDGIVGWSFGTLTGNLEPAVEETANDTVTLPWLRRSQDMSVIPEPKDPLSIEKTAQDSGHHHGFRCITSSETFRNRIHQYLNGWPKKVRLYGMRRVR